MAIMTHIENGTITASAGTGSATVGAGNNILMQMFVKATTGTTTFDINLTDIHSNVMIQRLDITGELNELIEVPAYGNWTLTVENSSVDEDLTYLFVFREV